jgi:hypothetical protein
MSVPHHEEVTVHVAAGAERLFEHLDDPTRLGGHMTKPSGMMLGGSMSYEFERGGREVGSIIRMTGTILGLQLGVEEIVTERIPPRRKVWETRGPQRMMVIDSYRMGFNIENDRGGARATVFIDYLPAHSGLVRLLSLPIARAYARWCVQRMADDVQAHFGTAGAAAT